MPTIKVKRDYCGAEGTDVDKNVLAGSTHSVTRARAAELFAVGLVEIISDEAHPDDEKEEDVAEEKGEPKPIANKQATAPANKVAPAADNKKPAKAS
ncbi:hypothetical protein JQK15_03940 [Sphingobium sp. BHU LFT2]|uniref:hypothetical protein n=1 Tax=Sphingobium sp. BHU LFT2 TaxID=2807634 RepID=UPI001BECF11E|nr:hypothetical protein [Sphingobium sp. BHU LFT2]MBT2242680.1 hypothetical protein [Sphingobium sp. BHU LFT2]